MRRVLPPRSPRRGAARSSETRRTPGSNRARSPVRSRLRIAPSIAIEATHEQRVPAIGVAGGICQPFPARRPHRGARAIIENHPFELPIPEALRAKWPQSARREVERDDPRRALERCGRALAEARWSRVRCVVIAATSDSADEQYVSYGKEARASSCFAATHREDTDAAEADCRAQRARCDVSRASSGRKPRLASSAERADPSGGRGQARPRALLKYVLRPPLAQKHIQDPEGLLGVGARRRVL